MNKISLAGIIAVAFLAFGSQIGSAQYARPMEVPIMPTYSAPPVLAAPPTIVCAQGTPGCPGYNPPPPPPMVQPVPAAPAPCQQDSTRPGC
jgi:hypothetical protein